MKSREQVRTPERPMAFSGSEFCGGAFATWILFMTLLVGALIVMAVQQSGLPWGPPLSMIAMYLMFGVPIGGAVSAVVTLVAAPIVHLIALRMSVVRALRLHAIVYALAGLLVGLLVVVVAVALTQGDLVDAFSSPLPWTTGALCAVSLTGGWAWAVWRAAGTRTPRPDRDAIAEDTLESGGV